MAIVTREYYLNTYCGEPVAEVDWDRFYKRSVDAINLITHGRVTEENFATLPAWQQNAVKTAICAQIEYFSTYGIDVAVAGRQGAEFTVGKVHVGGGGGSGSGIATGVRSMVSPGAYAQLEQTGLLNPQADVVCVGVW